MMLIVMALNKINKSVEITTKYHCFNSLNVIYLIYAIIDFMHAQNGDMSMLPSLHMQLEKIKRAALMLK